MTIGVFDSGLGGLTIVAEMLRHLRGVRIVYVADTANAPYGEKTPDQIRDFSIRITEYLIAHHRIDALVVACNTATSAAIEALRERYRDLIIVGTEPGLKPAISHSVSKNVGVLATPATLEGEKYKALVGMLSQHYRVRVFEQPCPGLVQQIEAGETDTPKTLAMLEGWLSPMRDAQVDTIVLGCTHYPLIKPAIRQVMGQEITFVDSAEGVTNRLLHLMEQKGHRNEGEVSLSLFATGAIEQTMVETILGKSFSVTMLNSLN
ncbi:MAG: glutamate racemase [Campylobacterota bacterium]